LLGVRGLAEYNPGQDQNCELEMRCSIDRHPSVIKDEVVNVHAASFCTRQVNLSFCKWRTLLTTTPRLEE